MSRDTVAVAGAMVAVGGGLVAGEAVGVGLVVGEAVGDGSDPHPPLAPRTKIKTSDIRLSSGFLYSTLIVSFSIVRSQVHYTGAGCLVEVVTCEL